MARFKLIHLTPRTREAFRIYRDAMHTLHAASTKLAKAQAWLSAVQQDIQRMEDGGLTAGEWLTARHTQYAEAHQIAEAKWQATADRAQHAFDTAHPLLVAEGYPFGWWHTGTMRLPAGVVSPGADRLVRQ